MEPKREVAAIENFIERIGLSAEEDGLPRIAGRMMAFFVVHGGPISFAELAERLRVSRGSVSTNTRILISIGVIERVSRPGVRGDYFKLAERPYARMMSGYLERTRRMKALVAETQLQLESKERAGAKKRLREMQRFYDVAARHFSGLLSELAREDTQAGRQAAAG